MIDLLIEWSNALRHVSTERLLVPRNVAKYDQESYSNTTVYKETLTGRPHGTSVQKAANDNENVDTV